MRDEIKGIRPPSNPAAIKDALDDIARIRGRPLVYPFIGSGRGRGALVELADGSVKWDWITSIGTHFFGHGDPEMTRAVLTVASADVPIQGHLQPNGEYVEFLRAVSSIAPGRCKHVWPSMSGTMANENALKIIRQRHAPAFRVLAFENAFAGRSALMSEISGSAANKKGQPDMGQAHPVPFYDPADASSVDRTVAAMDDAFKKHPGEFCAMHVELVQGEGGFRDAPREFFQAVFERCRRERVAVWVDEIQTFGRIGEYFMLTRLGLEEWADVVTIGKMLCGSAVLFSSEYNPDPGLVSGTFAGYTAGLALGAHVIRRLRADGLIGLQGKIRALERAVSERLQVWKSDRLIRDYTAVGAMAAFTPIEPDLDSIRSMVRKIFDAGVCVYYTGHGPYRIRVLLPGGCMSTDELKEGFDIMERCL